MIFEDELFVISAFTKGKESAYRIFVEKQSKNPDILGVCRVFHNENDAMDYLTLLEYQGSASKVTSKVTSYRVKDLVKILSDNDEIAFREIGKGIRAEACAVIDNAVERIDTFWTREMDKQH
jgi:hypothetical protein